MASFYRTCLTETLSVPAAVKENKSSKTCYLDWLGYYSGDIPVRSPAILALAAMSV